MLTLPSKLLVGAVFAASALLDFTLAGDCVNGPFAHVWRIGLGTSKATEDKSLVPFCSTLHDVGVPVTGLDVWYDEREGINAIQIQYANGDRSGVFGQAGSSPQRRSIDWDYSKAFVDTFSLWGNGGGAQLGNIRMTLTDGREFDVGNRMDTRSKKTEFPIDVGAGVMLGFGGWGSNNIKQGYALFLKSQIDHITMTDPVFDDSPENLNAQQKGIQTQVVDSYDHQNDLNTTMNMSFERTVSVHTSTTTTTSVTKTYGVGVSINWEASILAFSVGGGVDFSYEYSETNEKVETVEKDESRTFTYESVVEPGQHVYCQASAKTGKSDLGYTATINLILKDGSSWSWKEHGTYSQEAWGEASSKCQLKPFTNSRRSIEWHA